MELDTIYEKLPNELLGAMYCYLLNQLKDKEQLCIMQQIELIENIARNRDISAIELRILGYWVIQREQNFTKDENKSSSYSERVE